MLGIPLPIVLPPPTSYSLEGLSAFGEAQAAIEPEEEDEIERIPKSSLRRGEGVQREDIEGDGSNTKMNDSNIDSGEVSNHSSFPGYH